jgi:hypothetical protein
LATAAIQAYPFHATEKNVVRFCSLRWSGDEPQVLPNAAFLLPQCAHSLWAGWAGGRNGSPVLHRSANLFSSARHVLQRGLRFVQRTGAHIMTELTVITTKIRQLDGLYSLNDIHKAAGGEEKHAPANFIRLDQTQALIAELCSAEMQIIPTKTIRGRGKQQGTYVCKELVIAYAAWISSAFHLKVIRVFLDQSNKPALPDQSTQADQLAELIKQKLLKLLPQQDCLLPPHQAKEITERLNRLCQLFHPFSSQFADVHGVLRALWGCHPKLSVIEPSYRAVLKHPEKSRGG